MTGIQGWTGFREQTPILQRLCVSQSGRVVATLGDADPETCDDPAGKCTSPTHTAESPAITYEGTLYNRHELQSELAAAGAGPFGSSDAEIILAGYRAWGDAVVERLRGIFAFALWDGRGEGRLLLARDPYGRKPLYLCADAGQGLRFASTLKAMLNPDEPREVDTEAMRYYLDHGHPPVAQCLLRNCRKLRPGYLLIWEKGRLSEQPYRHASSVAAEETAAESGERFADALQARLRGDEPRGVLLSAGMGAAAVLAYAARQASGPLHSYAACLGSRALDEHEWARRSALAIGCNHHGLMVSPRAGRLLPVVASRMDEPLADPAALTDYLILRRARRDVSLLFAGTGMDEGPATARLTQLDRMSAFASLEVHSPLAGYRLDAGTIGRLPVEPSGQSRFAAVGEWLRSEWRTLAQDVLLDTRTMQRSWWNGREVKRMLEEHLSGRRSHGRRLYQLIILELWARSLLDGDPAAPIPPCVDDCARELPTDRPVRKVAVLAPAGIGDTMRLTPALRQLGASRPEVSVTLYVTRGRGSDEVMAGMAPVDSHVMIDFGSKGIGKLFKLSKHIRRTAPDRLVSTWVSTIAGLAGLISGVERRSGWVPQWSSAMRLGGLFWRDKVPYDPPQKDVGRYDILSFARLLGINPLQTLAMKFAPPIWEEKALQHARSRTANMRRPILAVSAAARAHVPQRQYPIDQMARALATLLRTGEVNSVVLVGDEAAKPTIKPLAEVVGPEGLDLTGELSVSATAAVIKECDAALVLDGALLHIVLASDLPVVALYGPTEIFSSDPRWGKGRYEVLSAFDRCRCTCLPHRGICVRDECREQAQCLKAIPPSRIVDAVTEVLQGAVLPLGRERNQDAI